MSVIYLYIYIGKKMPIRTFFQIFLRHGQYLCKKFFYVRKLYTMLLQSWNSLISVVFLCDLDFTFNLFHSSNTKVEVCYSKFQCVVKNNFFQTTLTSGKSLSPSLSQNISSLVLHQDSSFFQIEFPFPYLIPLISHGGLKK